jgi:alpha-D-ribose 1-methylphosphonate 5-triphosphate synthase subunit PhnG
MLSHKLEPEQQNRQKWLNLLALSREALLEEYIGEKYSHLSYHYLREPEIGLVMVRGRAGGHGQRFNLGEMTIARCSVQLPSQHVGHGYVKGRSKRHAELIAIIDAVFQSTAADDAFLEQLEQIQTNKKDEISRKAAATKVDFYTMVRGED